MSNLASSTNTMLVRTRQGDTLDLLCWRVYGKRMSGTQVVEQALLLNQGLADIGPVLPAGYQLRLPVLTTAIIEEVVQLWD